MNQWTCTPIRVPLLALLAAAGTRGALVDALARDTGRTSETVATALRRLDAEGLAGYWRDPVGRCNNRCRWWLTEHRPQTQPRPSGEVRSKPQQERRAGDWTHDPRYQVGPGEMVRGCGFSLLPPGVYTEPATSAAARAVGA